MTPIAMPDPNNNTYNAWVESRDFYTHGIKWLWHTIEQSLFWGMKLRPLRDAALAGSDGALESSRIDMIPYGIGICPSKAGSLVGVIRTGGQAWFIWRKTDESFEDEGIIHTVGTGTAGFSFQSRDSDGRLGDYTEGNYRTSLYSSDFQCIFDGDFADQFTGPAGRKLTKVGREVVWEEYTVTDPPPI